MIWTAVKLEVALSNCKGVRGRIFVGLGKDESRAGNKYSQKPGLAHAGIITREGGLRLAAAAESRIQLLVMRRLAFIPLVLVSVVLAGCTTHDRSPDEIREQTAKATATAARDAKAVAQGVAEGIKQQRSININMASSDDLRSLPGIDEATAHRIIEHRPYKDSYELVKEKIISRDEYDRIAGKVEAR